MLLSSLLRSSLTTAFNKAQRLACSGQMMRLANATTMYLDDYDGEFMQNRYVTPWDYLLSSYDGRKLGDWTFDFTGQIEEMQAMNKTLLCPSDETPSEKPSAYVRKSYVFSALKLSGSFQSLGLVPRQVRETNWGRDTRNIDVVRRPKDVLMISENRSKKNCVSRV
ncbi:MAG: hypothetical protein HQL32_12485, partial [Planctomycetes bacterium]|nr:hypothetical protein [Planctomycetota bacterium]